MCQLFLFSLLQNIINEGEISKARCPRSACPVDDSPTNRLSLRFRLCKSQQVILTLGFSLWEA